MIYSDSIVKYIYLYLYHIYKNLRFWWLHVIWIPQIFIEPEGYGQAFNKESKSLDGNCDRISFLNVLDAVIVSCNGVITIFILGTRFIQ